MSKGVPAMWMRGGTSKGLYFLKEDIPSNKKERDNLEAKMRKLAARKKDALPIGKLTIPGTFPGVNYGAIGVAEK